MSAKQTTEKHMKKHAVYCIFLTAFSATLWGCASSNNTPPSGGPQSTVEGTPEMCFKAKAAMEKIDHTETEFEKGVFYAFYCK
jgi:hypothetical protein